MAKKLVDCSVVIDHVVYDYTFKRLQVVAAYVHTEKSAHRIGFLKSEGWFCNCSRSTRCAQIEHVKKHVPKGASE